MRAELLIRKRIWKLMVVLTALFGAIVARIISLTVIQGEALTARGVRQWTQEGKVEARRGSIVDRNGETLALSTTAYIVSVNPRKVTEDAAFAARMAEMLDVEQQTILNKLKNKNYASVVLKRQVPRATVDAIRTLRAQDESAAKLLQGLSFSEDTRRVYIKGQFLAQALGLTNVDSEGQSGLEQQYDAVLKGEDGILLTEVDRKARTMPQSNTTYIAPQTGNTVQLTIDSRFQKAVDKALAENIDMINRVYNTGSMKAAAGAAVVLDVKDGSVLAASNYPSFDQNLYATQYSEYSADESLPLFNRALQGLYTPGSTFKPAVAVAALDSGLINQYSTVFCNGVYTFYKGYSPRCTRHGHSGNIDVVTAIKWSCNVFFYDVGRRLTSDVYDAYAYKLGLGQRTGVEVSEAVGHLTSKNDSNYMESLDVQAAIGQGNTVVTPIQLATYAATLANNGTRYRTHFVKAILDSNTGEVIRETQPEVMDIIEGTGNTFELVRQGMRQVPSTITNSKISSYPIAIACKTGTPQRSETYAPGKHYLNAMMVAYLPADDPQIAIGITIEYGGYGARTGDLVVDIANAYFAMQDGTLNEDGTIGKQETAADSTPADQTAPAQTETGTDAAADTATDPAAGTTDAAQETAPAGQDALDN